ncbi:MAG: LysR family transcriptional regulator [Agathobacter sp.]
MEFRRLYYFYILTQNMNFTKTAQALHITQPTLSQQIAELENTLGLKLFERTNRMVTLSPAGEALKYEAEKLFVQYERCIDVANIFRSGFAGKLNIVSLDVVEPTFLPQFLSYFTEKYPSIEVTISNAYFSVMFSMIEKASADFALTLMPTSKVYTNIKTLPANKDRLVIGIPKNHEYEGIKDVNNPKIEQILTHPGFMFSGWYSCTETIAYLKSIHDPLNLTYYDSASVMIMKLIEKKGFTIAPEKWLNFMDPQKALQYIELPEPYSALDFGLIYNTDNPNPCVPLFMKEATEFIAQSSR